jgi:hypothetical protein
VLEAPSKDQIIDCLFELEFKFSDPNNKKAGLELVSYVARLSYTVYESLKSLSSPKKATKRPVQLPLIVLIY